MATFGSEKVGATGAELLTDIRGVASLLTRSERSCRDDLAAGRLPAPLKLGGSTRWRVAELRDWVAAGCPSRTDWEARRK
jgi:predicted DNA-binding transcriptional regulator AlpA